MLSLANHKTSSTVLAPAVMNAFSDSKPAAQTSLLGEMLIRKGLLNRTQLQAALFQQQGSSQKLGEVLISMGLLSEKQLKRTLARQSSYRYAIALATAVSLPFAPAITLAGTSTTTLTMQTTSSTTTNLPPVISGVPAKSVTVGSAYYFKPTASDPEGKSLYFKIKNKPAWASFNSTTGELKGTPAQANIGLYSSIKIAASDGKILTYLHGFNVEVAAAAAVSVNHAPTASTDSYATNSNTAISNILHAADVDGDALTYSVTSAATQGTVVITNASTGAFTYTPAIGFVGSDSFSFSVTDIHGATATAQISLTMNSTNVAPIASDGSLSLNEDSSATGTLVAIDSNGDALTFSLSGQPTHGAVSLTNPGTGAFSYTPTPNYNGTDSFSFQVADGQGGVGTATVQLNIQAQNDTPTTSGANVSLNEDGTVSNTLTASDIDGDALTFSMAGNVAHGTLTLNATTGVYSYAPVANYNGTDSFQFRVQDTSGAFATAQVNFTVNAVNDAPVANNGSFSLNEDSQFNGQVSASDVDGGALTFSLIGNTTHGTLSLNATTGSFTYVPTANFFGSDGFSVQVRDTSGATATAQMTLSIASVDDLPIAVSDLRSTTSNTAITVAVLTNDTNLGDGGIVVSVATAPTHGSASVSGNQVIYTPANNYSGSDTISYRITDVDGDTSVSTIPLNVTCTQNCTSDVKLSWSAPTTKADGTALTNLSGFMVYYGTSSKNYSNAIDVAGATSLTRTIAGLTAGTYYFAVTAYDANGTESGFSTEISKTTY